VGKRLSSPHRERVSLNGLWLVQKSDSETPPPHWRGAARIWVPPGCWTESDVLFGYEGTAWYKREFVVPETWTDRRLVVCFDGVSYSSQVWLDNNKVSGHEGFCSFDVDLSVLQPGTTHSLFVRCDNRGGPGRIGLDCDWQNWGGILGEVFVEARSATHISDIRVSSRVESANRASVKVRVELDALTPSAGRTLFQLFSPQNNLIDQRRVKVEAKRGTTSIEESFEIQLPKLWEPDSPHLYRIDVRLEDGDGTLRDETLTRFGLWSVNVKPDGIELNGRPFMVKGIQYMHTYPGCGSAVPPHVVLADVERVKQAGANLVRTHYPVSTTFLDLCDELGVLVIESVPLFGPYAEGDLLDDPATVQAGLSQLDELMERDENHACVVSWGLWNEIESQRPECVQLTKKLIDRARARDPKRLLTFGSNRAHRGLKDACYSLAQVICVNVFCGWYDRDMKDLRPELDAIHAQFPEKPILVTEFGFDGMYGLHSEHLEKWSEEYQAHATREYLDTLVELDYVCGAVLCSFADWKTFRSSATTEGRPAQINHKGIVDSYRRPKRVFDTLREMWTQETA